MNLLTAQKPRQREFLPEDFKITVWSKLRPYYNELLQRPINSVEDLEQWLLDRSEVKAIIREEFNWRYINVSLNTEDQKAVELYEYAVQELTPRIAPLENQLDEKLLNCSFTNDLDKDTYFIHLRSIKNNFELFRKENVKLAAEGQMLSKEHGKLFSKMTVEIAGKEKTLQQALSILGNTDRDLREQVFEKIATRIIKDKDQLNELMNQLIRLRHQMAENAGFENYSDFKFKSLGRFDYSVEDCYDFHESIVKEIQPINEELNVLRRKELHLDTLRPWDLQVDREGKTRLQPFKDSKELINKTVSCLTRVNPFFGECISVMEEMGHLDLESRQGKRPGGYNMPLPMTGIPFIFMNSAGAIKDQSTMLHESGHAIHSFLTRSFKLNSQTKFPSEVAELAAMTMELITMDHWDVFYKNEIELRRAKMWQLEKVLNVLPWIAVVDKFQHWMYSNPSHTIEERKNTWLSLYNEFSSSLIDWTGFENYKANLWHKQLHIFEVPFYYIEYGFAQLGAIAIWKNYKENPAKAIEQYINALKLGNTKTIGEIYQTAGIEFNFSRNYVAELGKFVKKELEQLIFE